jgi:hypothetical protein
MPFKKDEKKTRFKYSTICISNRASKKYGKTMLGSLLRCAGRGSLWWSIENEPVLGGPISREGGLSRVIKKLVHLPRSSATEKYAPCQ